VERRVERQGWRTDIRPPSASPETMLTEFEGGGSRSTPPSMALSGALLWWARPTSKARVPLSFIRSVKMVERDVTVERWWSGKGKAAFRRPRKPLILLAPREGLEPPT
jgi:hypothetical protein